MVLPVSTTLAPGPQLCTSVIYGAKNSYKLAVSQMQTYFINFVVPVSSWEVYLMVNYSLVRNIVIQFESIVVSIERKLLKFISKMLVIEEQVREQSRNEFGL
jgi:flagellar biosynthesis regulator FlbT